MCTWVASGASSHPCWRGRVPVPEAAAWLSLATVWPSCLAGCRTPSTSQVRVCTCKKQYVGYLQFLKPMQLCTLCGSTEVDVIQGHDKICASCSLCCARRPLCTHQYGMQLKSSSRTPRQVSRVCWPRVRPSHRSRCQRNPATRRGHSRHESGVCLGTRRPLQGLCL